MNSKALYYKKTSVAYRYSILCIILISLSSCYSFKGVSISPELESYNVADFTLLDNRAPANLNEEFAEKLREKITSESRLIYTDTEPDIEFGGDISSYDVRSVAPQEGNTTALTRLEIRVRVTYTNNKDEEAGWQKPFAFFWDFESGEDLLSIQDELIEIIFDKIVEDVFI